MSVSDQHVVVVSQHYPPDKSGNASRVRDTCTHLTDEGWDVTVLSPPPAFPHGEFDRTWERKSTTQDEGVTAHRLWAWQPTSEDPGFISRMAYYLLFPLHALLWLLSNHRRYDVIITSSPPIFTGLAGLPFGLLNRKPWIVDVRDLWIDASVGLGFISEGGVLERLSRAYQLVVLTVADRVTVTTNVLGDRLTDQYGISGRKIVHLPNGVDTSVYKPMDNVPKEQIVYTGNVGHAQDLEACILAMKEVKADDVVLKIVGDGDVKQELEQIVREEGLEERVEFTGLVPRDCVPKIINNSLIGVAPLKKDETLEYAVPTKAYEYLACEVPIVATGEGEIKKLVEHSDGGFIVDNDPSEIAAVFNKLLSDSNLREELGGKGRSHIIGNFDRKSISENLSSIIIPMLSR